MLVVRSLLGTKFCAFRNKCYNQSSHFLPCFLLAEIGIKSTTKEQEEVEASRIFLNSKHIFFFFGWLPASEKEKEKAGAEVL